MTQAYGVMMTGVHATILGVNQAAMQEVDAVEQISQAVLDAKEDMLMPSNSCGDQSNQVCHLFLGEAGAKALSDIPYAVLSTDGRNLLEQIGTHDENLLIRFEVDRALTINFISIDKSVNNLDELTTKINSNRDFRDRLISHRGVVLVNGAFYKISGNASSAFEAQRIPSTEDECEELRVLCAAMDTDDEVYIKSDHNETEERLVNAFTLKNQETEGMWASSHSFTTFIPQKTALTTPHPYQYQAYFGRHTLQKWLFSNKLGELSNSSPDQYVEKLCALSLVRGSDAVLKHEMGLFSLGGEDEERMLRNELRHAPEAVRVKFKVASVDPEIAYGNLSELQEFFNANYKGSTPEEQVLAYEAEAKNAMTKQLEAQLEPLTVGSQKTHPADGVLTQKSTAFKTTLHESTRAAQESTVTPGPKS